MTKEFVTYEQALALKEIGFDEPCLGFYDGKGTKQVYYNNLRNGTGDFAPFVNNERLSWFCAPLKQQVFRFFREKYDYHIVITNTNGLGKSKGFGYEISIQNSNDIIAEYGSIYVPNEPWLNTYEEAESACIDKLIELVKNK